VLQQLVHDYRSGIPTAQLITRYGLRKGAVLKLLKGLGVVMRRRQHGVDD
jgi:hypothetical protein